MPRRHAWVVGTRLLFAGCGTGGGQAPSGGWWP